MQRAHRQYVAQGATFAKWRAALKVLPGRCPSDAAVRVNVQQLAEYAAVCQVGRALAVAGPWA